MTAVEANLAVLAIPADLAEIRRASAWLETAGRECKVPAEHILRLDLCLNEALANVIGYGGLDALSSPIRLSLSAQGGIDSGVATLTVTDAGVPFDPLAYQPKPMPMSLDEVEPGGLGILMMRDAADVVAYRYSEGCNQLTFEVRWPSVA